MCVCDVCVSHAKINSKINREFPRALLMVGIGTTKFAAICEN